MARELGTVSGLSWLGRSHREFALYWGEAGVYHVIERLCDDEGRNSDGRIAPYEPIASFPTLGAAERAVRAYTLLEEHKRG